LNKSNKKKNHTPLAMHLMDE